jgi:hypothetical protein
MFLGHAADQRRTVDTLTGWTRSCGARSRCNSCGSGCRGCRSSRLCRRYDLRPGGRRWCGGPRGLGRPWCRSWSRCLRGGRCLGRAVAGGINHAHYGLNRHGLAFADFDLLQHASGRGGNFRVDLVGRYFEQRLVALDLITRLLEPLGDGAFENAFAHLGHYDVHCHLRSPRRFSRQSTVYSRQQKQEKICHRGTENTEKQWWTAKAHVVGAYLCFACLCVLCVSMARNPLTVRSKSTAKSGWCHQKLIPRELLCSGENFLRVGQKIFLQRRRVGNRGVERSHAHQRSIEITERFLA